MRAVGCEVIWIHITSHMCCEVSIYVVSVYVSIYVL